MRITESKLRQMIRGVIREFTSGGSVGGAEHKGYQSATGKVAQSNFDAKSTDFTTKSAEYDTASDAVDVRKRFRKLPPKKGKGKGGGYQYTGGPIAIGTGWSTNPDYTSQVAARDSAETAKDSAETAKKTASTKLDTEKAADLEKTRPKQKPPSGGGAGFGKGKTAGKAKGKKKKN